MKWGASPREGDSSLRSNNRRSFGLILRISWQSLGDGGEGGVGEGGGNTAWGGLSVSAEHINEGIFRRHGR